MADNIELTERDFEELGEDVSASPLWNKDLAPTSLAERTWTTWNIAALWIGMSVVITTYTLAGGFIEAGMNWWQAMLTILLGNCIVLVPMVLNAHAGTKYGVSFPVLARASFGTYGANIPAILRAIVACGWFGIQTWIGGTAIDALLTAVWSGWASFDAVIMGNPLHTWISFFLFWIIQVVIILKGIEGIKFLESWAAPLLLLGGLILLNLGFIRSRRTRNRFVELDRFAKTDEQFLDDLSRRTDGIGRLLGDAKLKYSRFYALREIATVADDGTGARASFDDDGVRFYRRCRHIGDRFDLRRSDRRPGETHSEVRQRLCHFVCDARHFRRAIDDQYGGERRFAVERFFEPQSETNLLCDGRFDHGGDRDFDDAVAVDELDERVYFHVADRLFGFDGRDRRNLDLRLLGFAKTEIKSRRAF